MDLRDRATQARVEVWLARVAGARSVALDEIALLSGGAIQQNFGMTARFEGGVHAGTERLVLRTDAPSRIPVSHTRAQEFAIVQAAFAAGVRVPEPLWLCVEEAVAGAPFSVMRHVPGVAAGHRIVRDPDVAAARGAVVAQLGQQLARIHSLTPLTLHLPFLPLPEEAPALAGVSFYRDHLDRLGDPQPVLEWGLRWLERHAPPSLEIVLLHRDFRTGNYMVDGSELTAVLDWEFAGWGDRHEDIGWLCARCWRFGAWEQEVGGMADRATFYEAYERESGVCVDPARVRYWEVFAHVRWAVIALQQGARFLRYGEVSLDAALTGRRPAEMELEILKMTGPDAGRRCTA